MEFDFDKQKQKQKRKRGGIITKQRQKGYKGLSTYISRRGI